MQRHIYAKAMATAVDHEKIVEAGERASIASDAIKKQEKQRKKARREKQKELDNQELDQRREQTQIHESQAELSRVTVTVGTLHPKDCAMMSGATPACAWLRYRQ